jgi:hypothetical protein
LHSKEETMRKNMGRFLLILGIGLALLISVNTASAQTDAFKQLSAEWWQWALSIPTPVSPPLDPTGALCVVGQRGSVWFLAGNFLEGGTGTRTCAVPEGVVLFFPVINNVNIDSPNVCGQDSNRIPVEVLRSASAASTDAATNLLAELDGSPIGNLHRVQSKVFAVALPEDNVFDAPCANLGGVPAGIYSPAVDDGFYVRLNPLTVGSHTLHIHAENPSTSFVTDVTYNLTVVPVVLK